MLLPSIWIQYSLTQDCKAFLLGEDITVQNDSQTTHLEAAAFCFPWRTEFWEKAAWQAREDGDSNRMIWLLERAKQEAIRFGNLDDNALSLQSLEALSIEYIQLGEYPKALQVIQTIVARQGMDDELAQELSRLQLAMADFPAAIQVWQRLTEIEPDNASAHYQLGLLLAVQNPEDALAPLEEAVRLDQNYSLPVESLRQAILGARIHQDSSYTFLMAGRALASLSQWGLAAEAFRQSILLNPNFAEAWAFLGEARQHIPPAVNSIQAAASQHSDGLSELETAVALDPDSLAAHILLSIYYQRQGIKDGALQAMQKAVAIAPDNPTVVSQYASLLAENGDLDGAYEAYQQASQLAPYDPAFIRQIILFSVEHNYQIAEIALPLIRQLIIDDSTSSINLDLMGQVLVSLGDLTNAERFFIRSLRSDPGYAPAYLHLGLVYLLQGNPASAQEFLAAAIDLDPGGSIGDQARRLLDGGQP